MDARLASAVAPFPLPPAIDVDVDVLAAAAASWLGRRADITDCDKREGWW